MITILLAISVLRRYEGDDEERIELVGKEHNEADAFAVFNAVMSGILDLSMTARARMELAYDQ